METIIEVKNLTKDYGFGRGVFNISFQIKKGETFGFLGPNGAGKTTTIRHLMGFSNPGRGETLIFGKETFKNYASILKHVGYIPGELAFPAGLTGHEVIKMMQDLVGKSDQKRLKKLCDLFELDHRLLKANTKQMSLGTKRKLAIVTAFMSDPEVLILDEPTSGLDPIMQDVFIALVKEEKRRGKTILLSSHLFNEVDQTCDRISIIKEGKIMDTFVANDLRHAKHKSYELKFAEIEEYRKLIQEYEDISFFNVLEVNPNTLEVLISTHDDDIDQVVDYLSSYELSEFTNKKETLQDYFLKFYRDGKEFGGLK
ncbi:MAG: ABC transporter ATP-binding protein [Erysipelotrichia bacterium]|nr:ABC transporter ATP-binding protein [Erysipelotrichia bacterium]